MTIWSNPWRTWAGPQPTGATTCLVLPGGDADPELLKNGQAELGARVGKLLQQDPSLAEIGLEIVRLRLASLKPTPDVEKALEAPTREEIQKEADEAAFQRRAAAVEMERAISENELQTKIELSIRREKLIEQQGANRQREAVEQATAQKIEIEGAVERETLQAAAAADRQRLEATAAADATRLTGEAEA